MRVLVACEMTRDQINKRTAAIGAMMNAIERKVIKAVMAAKQKDPKAQRLVDAWNDGRREIRRLNGLPNKS